MKKIIVFLLVIICNKVICSEKIEEKRQTSKKASSAPNSPRVTPVSEPLSPKASPELLQSPRSLHSLPPRPPKTPSPGPAGSPSANTSRLQRSPSASTIRTQTPPDFVREIVLQNRTRTTASSSLPTPLHASPAHSNASAASPQSNMRRLSSTSTTSSTSSEAEQFKNIAMVHADAAQTAEKKYVDLSKELLEKCQENAGLQKQVTQLSAQVNAMTNLLQQHGIMLPKKTSRPPTPEHHTPPVSEDSENVYV